MIVNIRGTSGSGKSTLARRIMGQYPDRSRMMVKGRKQPAGYILNHPEAGTLVVIGHYESPCGGCDTIKTYHEVFQAIRDAHDAGCNVLFEGLLLSTDRNHMIELAQEYPNRHLIIGLDAGIEKCLASVNERRRAKNPDVLPVNPKGTISKHGTNQRIMAKFIELGLKAEWHDRESAFKRICKELCL